MFCGIDMQYTKTIMPYGLEWKEIIIEVAMSRSLPSIEIIGLPDSAIKESRERLRAAFRACGVEIPPHKYVINLAPSDVRKSGTLFDMAIAMGLLLAIDNTQRTILWHTIDEIVWFGELGLDGSVKWSHHIFAWVMAGIQHGYKVFIVPKDVAKEVSYIPWITVYAIAHFREIVEYINHGVGLEVIEYNELDMIHQFTTWLSAIQWHSVAKRALAIAACGMHNVLMIGPPWSGKSMLAKWLRNILLPMGKHEMMEVTHLHSLVGELSLERPIVTQRPFRTVHSTSSKYGVLWWWANMSPWELSLAHKGVLFFDEIAEFPRDILDSLRQPLEDKNITITRLKWSVNYPCQCMFVCAMNPCPCGYFQDGEKPCICSTQRIKKYQSKISGPILDRIDMVLEIKREKIVLDGHEVDRGKNNDSELYDILLRGYEMQKERYKNSSYTHNSNVNWFDIDVFIPMSHECRELLEVAANKLALSLRVVHKTITLARSIADFAGRAMIEKADILEALQYRSRDRMVK